MSTVPAPMPQSDTTEALLTQITRLVEEERAVNDNLRARATGLAGFLGVVVTLAGVVFTGSLDAPLSIRIVAVGTLAVALAAELVAVVMLVRVIAPREGARARISLDEVKMWPGFGAGEASVFRLRVLADQIDVLDRARSSGRILSDDLRATRLPIAVGIGLTSIDALLVALFNTNVL